MLRTHQVLRRGDNVIIGIGLECAVLDILTTDAQIDECIKALSEEHRGLMSIKMGDFGIYPVTLNVHHDGEISIFVDGPYFDASRCQSAAIWVEKPDLRRILIEAKDTRSVPEAFVGETSILK